MDWIQVVSLIATLLGGVFYIHMDVRDIRRDINQQASRIDKLYEMFVDLLKQKK